MNTYQTVNTDYLRPSRTLETIVVSRSCKSKVLYLYNYEGYSFRLFENLLDFVKFFQNKVESDYHFNSENELDNFLKNGSIID
jgi:hypothetical protein